MGFFPLELLWGRRPGRVLDLLKVEKGGGSKPELKGGSVHPGPENKAHTLGKLLWEKLLQAQERRQRFYNRGTKLIQFALGDLYCSSLLAPNYLWASGKFFS